MTDNYDSLSQFHPLIKKWFIENIGLPTDIQSGSWPVISKNENVLITAPTGCGKTLCAFLWSINKLITETWESGCLSVLYVSPMKALNNDIQKNLIKPLEELKEYFYKNGQAFPDIRILTRSGDTPYNERRQIYKKPPEILITTPESLNIILTSKNNKNIFKTLKTVILDEIHSVVGTKRGTHLITAVDRLTLIAGEFQRIAISATVKPLNIIGDFLGGYIKSGTAPDCSYKKRKVHIIRSSDLKKYELQINFPDDARESIIDGSWWPSIINDFKKIIKLNKSTLFFTNSRRLTEKVSRLINENEDSTIAYSHHGALSKEIRLTVEEKLKKGELKAIIATNSLELGIDIGDLDLVVLIQTPFSISGAIQRIGRSGHKINTVCKGIFYPTHGRDFIDSAVVYKAVLNNEIEEIKPVDNPLDVLAQVILSMASSDDWDIDELYYFIKSSYPYKNLKKHHFDLIINMLEGKYADSKIRELIPRLSVDRVDNIIRAKSSTSYLLYMSGGTIPDRGYFNLKISSGAQKIGELDEEFVWERAIGDVFTLGTQLWKIVKIDHNNVEVVPTEERLNIIPFWKADELNRDFFFSDKIGRFLEFADANLENSNFKNVLMSDYGLTESAAGELVQFLWSQKNATGSNLPHRHNIVIEHFEDTANRSGSKQVIIHTFWGGAVNKPFAFALSSAWEDKYKYPLQITVDNDAMVINLPHKFNVNYIFNLVVSENLEKLIRQKLETTGFFGARFRENAGRALLLTRVNFNKRMPLWLNRLRSKKLFEAVIKYEDFPILLETWRTCLQDDFDLINLKMLIDEIHTGKIKTNEVFTDRPSPFTSSLIWRQTNKFMYEDDTPDGKSKSNLTNNLIKDLLYSTDLRPQIPVELIKTLEDKLQRTAPGYSPGSDNDLVDYVKDRLLILKSEWDTLTNSIIRDHDIEYDQLLNSISNKIILIKTGGNTEYIVAVENLPCIINFFNIKKYDLIYEPVINSDDSVDDLKNNIDKILSLSDNNYLLFDKNNFFSQWLSFYCTVNKSEIYEYFSLSKNEIDGILEALLEDDIIVADKITKDKNTEEICDSKNLEILLRMLRRYNQPVFKPLNIDYLPLFLAEYQGILDKGESLEDLQYHIARLFGYPLSVSSWEEYVLPNRIANYFTSWLDGLFNTSSLCWLGCGNKKITFLFREDLDLFFNGQVENDRLHEVFPEGFGKYSFFDIKEYTKLGNVELSNFLWENAWKGYISNDSFEAVRNGIVNKFRIETINNEKNRRQSSFARWKSTRPLIGNWFLLNKSNDKSDSLEEIELIKDRIRILLDRYGILFKELLEYERDELKWKNIFKVLRLMELSDEILSGCFFKEIPGLQFISYEAYRILQNEHRDNNIFWMNAVDPASLCGIKIDKLKNILPSRISSNIIVYHGTSIVLVSKKNCNELIINVKPDDMNLLKYYDFFKSLLSRQFNPLKKIEIININNISALDSEYKKSLKEYGFKSSYKCLELWRKY